MQKNKIKPLGERVLVEPLEEENKSAGGIILGNAEKLVSSNLGVVLAKGISALNVEVGDKVMYSPHSGMMVKLNNKDSILIIRETDIQAVIT